MSQIDSETGPGNGTDRTVGIHPLYGREEDVDPRTFHRLPHEEVRAGRCTKCRSLKDLTREDPNGKRFSEGCFETMTGGA